MLWERLRPSLWPLSATISISLTKRSQSTHLKNPPTNFRFKIRRSICRDTSSIRAFKCTHMHHAVNPTLRLSMCRRVHSVLKRDFILILCFTYSSHAFKTRFASKRPQRFLIRPPMCRWRRSVLMKSPAQRLNTHLHMRLFSRRRWI